ncbi:MAG: sialate O-acetylesterase [Phycisphaerae bacterium]
MNHGGMKLAPAAAWACVAALVVAGEALAGPGEGSTRPVKVYLMAGQSNMVGPGSNTYVRENHPELMKPRKDVWCVNAGKVSGPLRPGYGYGESSFGLELTMGHVLGDAVENAIVLFKTGTGGTTLHRNWRPPSAVRRAGGEVGPLYTRMIRRFHNMLAHLDEVLPALNGRPVELAGFVWFQGENDCCAREEGGKGYWEYYEENLRDLIGDVRREVGVAELPVLIVQINDGCWDGLPRRGGTVLRPIQRKVAENDPHGTWIETCDLNSGYHYDSASHITIGRRAGKALLPFIRKTVPQRWQDVVAARKRFFARFPGPGSPDTGSLRKGLLGYWRFDEGAGATTADSSAGGIEGLLKGAPAWTEGRLGKAVKLTGPQSIEFPRFKEPLNGDNRIQDLSVAYWLRTNRYGDAFVGKGEGYGDYAENRHNWYYNQWTNRAGWSIACHDTDGGAYATAGFDLTINGIHGRGEGVQVVGDGIEWHHVALVYDGGRKMFDLYVDGSLLPKEHISVRRALKGIGDENHIVPSRRAKLTLGGHITTEGQFQVFDELAIWDRPLAAAEVEALYNNGYGAGIAAGKADDSPSAGK